MVQVLETSIADLSDECDLCSFMAIDHEMIGASTWDMCCEKLFDRDRSEVIIRIVALLDSFVSVAALDESSCAVTTTSTIRGVI